jgi:hypothetical protein
MPILIYYVRPWILDHACLQSRLKCGIIFWVTDSYSKKVACFQKKVIWLISRIKGRASCGICCKARKILTMASIYILELICFFMKEYHMNIEYSYYVHKNDNRCSHELHISDSTTSVYQNGVFNMDIKSYNKLPEKIKRLHTMILKRSWNQYFCKMASIQYYIRAAL